MVSTELRQLINGDSPYLRERAPEPLLLPRIALRISPDGLGRTASAANTLSRPWAPACWPAIADATAAAIASRHTEISDDMLRDLCDELPRLTLSLVEHDEVAAQRAETVTGKDAAARLRAGLADSAFHLREAVSRVFDERDTPATADDLMSFIRERTEYEAPELQRNLLAYFLPLAPAGHHQWMVSILSEVMGAYPDWGVAVAASRIAGLLDKDSLDRVMALLKCEEPWAGHVASLLSGGAAGSVFEEVARAFPFDSHLEALLAGETETAFLTGFTDGILLEWGGAPVAMAAAPDDDVADEFGAEPASSEPDDWIAFEDDLAEDAPASEHTTRGFDPFGTDDDLPDDAPSPGSTRSINFDDLMDLEFGAAPEPPPPPPSSPAPSPSEPLERVAEHSTERILQTRVFADDDGIATEVSQGFWKDTRHDVHLWIGPEKKRSIRADRKFTEPEPTADERQKGSMEIVITLAHGSDVQSKAVDLPVDRAERSDIAKFSLNVGKTYVRADVWLQHKGRILQYFELNGPTHDDPEEKISLNFQSAIRGIPVDTSGSDFEMAIVQKDNKYIVFGPAGSPAEVSLSGSSEVVEELNKDLFKSTMRLVRKSEQNNGETWVDNHNEEALKLLRKMATRGNLFYQELKRQGVLHRFSETIQFVNLDKSDIVPVEYVYDRGYPKVARLCKGFRDSTDWNKIFAAGKCTCSDGPEEDPRPICPMGFWSLSKVIERQSGSRGKPPAAAAGLAQPSGNTPPIALDRYALLAAAPNVNSEDVESIEDTLGSSYPDRFTYASGWDDWQKKIENTSPKLLVLLPHHGESKGEDTDFLEIKSENPEHDSKLFSGELNEHHVSVNPDEPGPIVLLLGCETAESGLLPYSRFARDFLSNRASIVVGTQASILGRHAAEAANEFIRQLLTSVDGDRSFGRIMRNVRQKMFASGHLMSLTLVSFGDADWKLKKSTSGESDVSN